MKIYVTKWALKKGIVLVDGESSSGKGSMRILSTGPFWGHYLHRTEWGTTLEEAILKAELARNRRITALKKEIQKLRNLTFT